ncbi:MAG: hypothetical protein ACJAVV_003492 [Alphaproteobacteria bacterium]|jgi:hypothetical protein
MLKQFEKSDGFTNGFLTRCKRTAYIAGLLLMSTQVFAQDASDIWVGKLNLWEKQPISELVQITDTAYYTNQPYFFDNARLFFTQAIELEDGETQMDALVFDFKLGKSQNITQSTVSEYSPTPLLNKSDMSVIRVSEEGKQELWQIDLLGNPVQHLAPLIEPVGYQVWLNDSELLLFVLGEPNTLQRIDALNPEAKGEIIDSNIGASLYRFEKTDWFLYTSKLDGNFLNAHNKRTNKTIQIVSMPKNSEYFSVSRMGNIITSDGETLWQRKFMVKGDKIKPLDGWQAIKIKQPECSKGVTRTAISPDTSMIALVCPRD